MHISQEPTGTGSVPSRSRPAGGFPFCTEIKALRAPGLQLQGGPGGRSLPGRSGTWSECPQENALRLRLRLAGTIAELRLTLMTVLGSLKPTQAPPWPLKSSPNYCSGWRQAGAGTLKVTLKGKLEGKKQSNKPKKSTKPPRYALVSKSADGGGGREPGLRDLRAPGWRRRVAPTVPGPPRPPGSLEAPPPPHPPI